MLMKYKRSQIKKLTLKVQVLRYMRKTCGLSANEAGRLLGCSGGDLGCIYRGSGAIACEPGTLV